MDANITRSLLGALAVPALATIVTPPNADTAFAQWKQVHAELNAWPEDDGDDHLCARLNDVETEVRQNAHTSPRALEVSLWVGLQPMLLYGWEFDAIMSEDIATLIRRNEGHEACDRLVINAIAAVRRLAAREEA
jgi:hypothetical protein